MCTSLVEKRQGKQLDVQLVYQVKTNTRALHRIFRWQFGSTSLAEDASHLALGTRFFDLIEDRRTDDRGGLAINTLGEALQAAKSDLSTNAPEHLESNYSITLFGDPAMRIW